tara:strand:+ start:776 stop:1147 length:372 start_codon:yes stop_codon:yes gene_type:complete
MKFFIFILIFLFFESPIAVEPNEKLQNKELEDIAKKIGKKLRCMICQNEDIESSNADVAKDLRVLIRNRLVEGETEKEIIKYVHSRYGDYVLFSPPLKISTLGLWLIPLFFTIVLSYVFYRKK